MLTSENLDHVISLLIAKLGITKGNEINYVNFFLKRNTLNDTATVNLNNMQIIKNIYVVIR